jgi:phospholipid transport system substrate-binding protein
VREESDANILTYRGVAIRNFTLKLVTVGVALFVPVRASSASKCIISGTRARSASAARTGHSTCSTMPNTMGPKKTPMREALAAIFDYEEMAKRALGPHWRQRTPAEQEEFVKLFRDFLERVYSDKIDLYAGQKVRFGREVIDNEFAQVESTISQPKSEEITVVYKLRQVNGQWKVYDAIVDNVSIVNNYRSQFDRVISSSSYEEPVKRLREKAG